MCRITLIVILGCVWSRLHVGCVFPSVYLIMQVEKDCVIPSDI